MSQTLNLTLSAADMFFSTETHAQDWNRFSEGEKTNGIQAAIRAVEMNAGDKLLNVANGLVIDDGYDFSEFMFIQAWLMLENSERFRTTSGPLAVMTIAEDKPFEQSYKAELPPSYLFPQALSRIGIIPSGVVQGRS